MKTKFIESEQVLHPCYSPVRSEVSSVCTLAIHRGRVYKFLGIADKNYTFSRRVLIAVRAIVKTFFTFGLALLSPKVRENWKKCFTGKKPTAIYIPSEFNQSLPLFNNEALVRDVWA